jgi:hypothetical protein
MKERLIAIPPEFRRMIVHIRPIPEERGGFPRDRARAEAACEIAQLRAGLIDAGIPHREEITVRTFGDRGTVVVPGVGRTLRVWRHDHEGLRSFEEWGRLLPWLNLGRGLGNVLGMERRGGQRQRFSFRPLSEDDAEADAIVYRLRHPGTAVGRAKQAGLQRMTASTDHAQIAVDATERIASFACLIGSIPVRAPLSRVAVQVVEPPGIRRGAGDFQRKFRGLQLILRRQFLIREKAIAESRVGRPRVKSIGQGVAGVEQRLRPRATGVLPLGLGGEAVVFSFLL